MIVVACTLMGAVAQVLIKLGSSHLAHASLAATFWSIFTVPTLFIGYCLSLLALESYQRVTVVTFLVPLLALAVPLLDTSLSILRRLRRRSNVMVADSEHIHHRLLRDFDGSHRPAVLSLYFLTACFCLIAISFTKLHGIIVIVFLALVFLLTYRILKNLGLISAPAVLPAEAEREAP